MADPMDIFRRLGLGCPPFSLWAAIRLPPIDRAASDPAMAARRAARIASESRLFHVNANQCSACGNSADDLYVITDTTNRINVALCRACVEATGFVALNRKATHLDYEFRRLIDTCSRNPAPRRGSRFGGYRR
jgi:hypothetical protein